MKNLAFHGLLWWKMIILPTDSHYLTCTFLFRKVGGMYFLNLGMKGLMFVCIFSLEGGKSATTPKATTPWKVTPKQGYEPMFGPMSPPPSGSVPPQQSPSSVRSDMSSSTSSIMGKSGEWTVSSKLEGIPGPRLPERQHAGWQVKDKGDSKREEVDSEEEEEERRKKKKKHKKEKRKRKEKKGKAKRKYRKLEGDSESEPLDNEEEGESEDKEKRKKNKKRKKKHKSKKRAGSDSCSDLDDETETTALLSKGSGDTKTRKRKIGRDKDEGGGAKKHRLVDYSDGSSSEGSVSADPGEKSKSKSKHSNNGSKDSKQGNVRDNATGNGP